MTRLRPPAARAVFVAMLVAVLVVGGRAVGAQRAAAGTRTPKLIVADIAPTLAFLADVTLPHVSGRVLIEALTPRTAVPARRPGAAAR